MRRRLPVVLAIVGMVTAVACSGQQPDREDLGRAPDNERLAEHDGANTAGQRTARDSRAGGESQPRSPAGGVSGPNATAERSGTLSDTLPRAGEYVYRTERASAKDPLTIETMEADDFYRSTLKVQALTGGRIRTEVDRRKEGGVRTTRELGIASTDSISETAVTISMDQGEIEYVWEDPLK